MDIAEEFELLIKSKHNLIEFISYEQERVLALVMDVADELDLDWYVWDCNRGLEKYDPDEVKFDNISSDLTEPEAILNFILNQKFKDANKPPIFVLNDFHVYLDSREHPSLIEQLRELSSQIRQPKPYVILLQPIKVIPEELVKDISVITLDLPDIQTLKDTLKQVVDTYKNIEGYENIEINWEEDRIFNSVLGLTIMEARLAFKKAIVRYKKITEDEIPFLIEEKGKIIRKKRILEYIPLKESMDDVGGLDLLKEWLRRRRSGFSKVAKEFGITAPRGILLLGIPGCGKSLTAKAVAYEWELPLLRFDIGKVFSQYVGESESNIREALQVAEAISPCVLWIDEIEKGFAGVSSSDKTDSGVAARIFGSFLTWMQEKEKPVFVVATANNIDSIPPELLRKGRFDEIFFVDLPTEEERKEIFEIQLKLKERDPSDFNCEKFARESQNFTGAEIKEAIEEALYLAFSNNENLENKHILQSIKEIKPIFKTMGEKLNDLRVWALNRTRFASSKALEESKKIKTSGEIPELRQEASFLAFSKKRK